MRKNWSLNALLVTAAASGALVLTVVRRSPEGLVSFQLSAPEVRAAPGGAVSAKHDLSALKIFNLTLVRIKERYVDPNRIDPRKMLYAALDSVQFNIPEVLIAPNEATQKVVVKVNDRQETFDTADVDSPWRLAARLKSVFRFIEANMNAGADLAEVEYAAVNGMLSTLDPHSNLMDPESAREMDVSTSGKFGGLGIVIRMVERKLMVIRPMKGTPADRAGILAGDHIVKINQDPTENLTSDESVDRMRGVPKTPVTLWIKRKGETELRRFDLMRDEIRVESVVSKLLDKSVGFIRIKSFSGRTVQEVAAAMRDLRAAGATSWVLDLRSNPGGLLDQAIKISDLFVDSGALVTTVGSQQRDVHKATSGAGDTSSAIAVLVNGNSASASEILAGALKNLDRAVIIGGRTFGKGSVQELYDNVDGSKLKLTIAQYLTPGDRSIQSVGIVPDIQLQRMLVPDKNQDVGDWVRMLPPSRQYGEKDLDAHLVSSYAKDAEKPTFELPFLYERPTKATTPTTPPDGEAGEDGEDDDAAVDQDEIIEDFEIKFARDLAASLPKAQRPELLRAAAPLVQRAQATEEQKLAAALGKLGLDWTVAGSASGAKLAVSVSVDKPEAAAGDTIVVTATATNQGTAPATRVLGRVHSDDYIFDDLELPLGRIEPGQSKTYQAKVRVPKDVVSRLDRLTLEVTEQKGATATVAPATVRLNAAPRPVFAYTYQLADAGNGDGLVQRGEKFNLAVTIKNTGAGSADETAVMLRNASGDGVALDKSRFEVGKLGVGDSRTLTFPIAVGPELEGDLLVLEVMMYDGVLGASASEKLKFPVRAAVPRSAASAVVEAKGPVTILAAAATDATAIGTAAAKAKFASPGAFGPFTAVTLADGTTGFIASNSVGKSSGSATGAFARAWLSTPPELTIATGTLESSTDAFTLTGSVKDETHAEDVYVYVSNSRAKIDGRKVFYRSNRGSASPKAFDFSTQIPLWPGSNQVTVVARESTEVKSIKTFYIYREPPITASK